MKKRENRMDKHGMRDVHRREKQGERWRGGGAYMVDQKDVRMEIGSDVDEGGNENLERNNYTDAKVSGGA